MKRLTRREVGLGAAALAVAAPARANDDGDSFEYDAVSNLAPARSVLWSWTTLEQVNELRAGAPLFTRVTNGEGERGYLHTILQQQKGRAVELLRSTRFDKGRFGWWNPWATSAGFLGETWGDQLLRIELSPRCWLAIVRSSQQSAKVVDLDNQPVSEAQLEAAPERLAGAFFVHDTQAGPRRGWCNPSIGGWAYGYREVYLGDEALIRGWSLASGQIGDRLEEAADGLERLARFEGLENRFDCHWTPQVMADWDRQERSADPVMAYRRALAFASEDYLATQENLTRLAKLLRDRKPKLDPFAHGGH